MYNTCVPDFLLKVYTAHTNRALFKSNSTHLNKQFSVESLSCPAYVQMCVKLIVLECSAINMSIKLLMQGHRGLHVYTPVTTSKQ